MRFSSLQGLRGVAALAVAVSHFLALFYLTGIDQGTFLESIRPVSHLFGILAYKAVWVFFVLSGFVLTHQLSSRQYKYRDYIFSRLVRLYIPVWFFLLISFGVIFALLANQVKIDFWIGTNPYELTPLGMLLEFTLLPDSYFLGPLWSLKWEVVFSLFAFMSWRSRIIDKWPILTISVSLLLSAAGDSVQNGWLHYLPMFVIGVALYKKFANNLESSDMNPIVEVLILAAAGLFPVLTYLVSLNIDGPERLAYTLDAPASLGSICLLFFLLLRGKLLRTILETKILGFLGNISFSLYLLHSPIILLAAYLTDFHIIWVSVAFLLVFPLSYLSFKIVEEPSMKLARRLRSK